MPEKRPRMGREKRTIEAMIHIYCHDQHGGESDLCHECRELLDYAWARLDRCPFQEDKPNCAKCPIHCYKPVMRERVIAVMRYAGPRMLSRHPVLTFHHLMNAFKKR